MKLAIHWNKQQRMWSLHTYKGCQFAKRVLIVGPWRTETKPDKKSNPRGWVVAEHHQAVLDPGPDELTGFQKGQQLLYDKENVSFNIPEGEHLLFDEEGCFLVKTKDQAIPPGHTPLSSPPESGRVPVSSSSRH